MSMSIGRAPSTLLSAQVWVADQPGTVCAWEGEGGVDDMKAWRSVEAQAGMVWPVSQNDLPTGRGYIRRGWPRLAEAGGRPELDLALAGRIKAGERIGRSLWAAVLHLGAAARLCGA